VGVAWSVVVACASVLPLALAAPVAAGTAAPLGVWRGTSTCTDRVAAPACRDEVVVYEFKVGAKAGTVHWQADKVVDGERQTMGEMDLAYDAELACWKGEFVSPRVHSVWCLVVDGAHMTGTAWVLPGKQTIRKIDVRRD
jgi:hypothetical protein